MTATEAPTRLKCSETRKDGQPCGAWAVRQGKCAGHAGLGIAADPAANQALAAASRRAVAEQRRTTGKAALNELYDRRSYEMYEATFDQACSGDTSASKFIHEAIHGKPKETVEVSGGLDLTAMTGQERAELVRRALADSPGVLEALPAAYLDRARGI